jgi:hypothetical protein
MSPFEVVHAIQSAGVGVVGLDLRRTVVVLRFVDVGETAVIRHPVTSATVARVRIDDERAGPPPSPIQTYKQSWISTAAATAARRVDRLRGPGVPLVLPPTEEEEEEKAELEEDDEGEKMMWGRRRRKRRWRKRKRRR